MQDLRAATGHRRVDDRPWCRRSSTSRSRSTTKSEPWSRASCASTRTSPSTSRSRGGSRSSTTPRPTARGGRRPGSRAISRRPAPCISTARAADSRCARAWTASDATVVAYMDVDLSTDLDALLPLRCATGVGPLRRRDRFAALARFVTSRGIRSARSSPAATTSSCAPRSRLACRDAQCGFKAVRADVAPLLVARNRRRGLVLRHRTLGPRRTQRPAHPRGAGRLDRRHR